MITSNLYINVPPHPPENFVPDPASQIVYWKLTVATEVATPQVISQVHIGCTGVTIESELTLCGCVCVCLIHHIQRVSSSSPYCGVMNMV